MQSPDQRIEGPHILIVDDNREIRELLAKYLAKNGMRVSHSANAAEARRALKEKAIDLIVLDIMMPGEDGLSLCRHIQETSEKPVIFLSAMAEDTDRIVGLEIGADDYLTKPFNPRELLARIKAVTRRSNNLPQAETALSDSQAIRFDHWVFDPERREVRGEDGTLLNLSTGEFRLLSVLLSHPGIVMTRDRLLDLTRGRDSTPFDRSMDNQVSRLRKKLERDPKNPEIIKTVWGGGYVLSCTVEAQ
ncbi:response regulator [Hwanghaeella grinnelliae]|uniref:response regulator n=1 Tax=Hwanghaeella grinnelliae TaxID=2500179 RepID=UPI001F005B64|nr:response regulator [Hwanghaeella grinnelliae]